MKLDNKLFKHMAARVFILRGFLSGVKSRDGFKCQGEMTNSFKASYNRERCQKCWGFISLSQLSTNAKTHNTLGLKHFFFKIHTCLGLYVSL